MGISLKLIFTSLSYLVLEWDILRLFFCFSGCVFLFFLKLSLKLVLLLLILLLLLLLLLLLFGLCCGESVVEMVERSGSCMIICESWCCSVERSIREWFLSCCVLSLLACTLKQYFLEKGLYSEISLRKYWGTSSALGSSVLPVELGVEESSSLWMSFSLLQTMSLFLSCHFAYTSSIFRMKIRGQSSWQKQYSRKAHILLDHYLLSYHRFRYYSPSFMYSISSQIMLL